MFIGSAERRLTNPPCTPLTERQCARAAGSPAGTTSSTKSRPAIRQSSHPRSDHAP